MASASGVNLGNGTARVDISGVAGSATYCTVKNTTNGNTFYAGAYNNTSLSVTNTDARPGVNGYSVSFYTSSGGSLIGTVTTSADVTWPAGSVTAQVSGPYSGCSWSVPDDANGAYVFDHLDLYYRIGTGSFTLYGSGYGLSGNIGTPLLVGYGVQVTWEAVVNWRSIISGYPPADSAPTGTATTPPAPPAAPGPVTNLHVTADAGTSVSLAWAAPSGGATGYEISRSINGGAYTTLTTQAGVTYTDPTPGAVRPITYRVRAYNTGAGGTTYGSYVTVATSAADSVGVLMS